MCDVRIHLICFCYNMDHPSARAVTFTKNLKENKSKKKNNNLKGAWNHCMCVLCMHVYPFISFIKYASLTCSFLYIVMWS